MNDPLSEEEIIHLRFENEPNEQEKKKLNLNDVQIKNASEEFDKVAN